MLFNIIACEGARARQKRIRLPPCVICGSFTAPDFAPDAPLPRAGDGGHVLGVQDAYYAVDHETRASSDPESEVFGRW